MPRWLTDRPVWSLVTLFVFVHLLLLALGCRFDADNMSSWMQIGDPALLREHLLRTLWYLHSQPPLFNLLIGLALKLGDPAFPWAMGILYAAVTLGGILTVHALARDLTGRPGIALLVAGWLCLSPAVLLFSQKLYYDSLVPWMLVMGFWGLHSGLVRRSFARLAIGFAMIGLVVLLRSMIHPIIFAMILGVYLLFGKGQRVRLIGAAAGPAIVIGLLLLKNLMLFGVLGFSSWAPLNLAHTTTDRLPPALLHQLIAEGRVPPLAAIQGFAPPEVYIRLLPPIAPTGEPSLDNLKKSTGEPNWNHIVYTKMGGGRASGSLAAIAANPADFAKVLVTSLYHFHRPSSEFKGLERNLAHIAWWDRIANATVSLQPAAWFGSSLDPDRPQAAILQPSYAAVLVTIGFAGAILRLLSAAIGYARRREWPLCADEATVTALALTGSFVILVSSTFDVWENNRAHYSIAPVLILAALWFAFGCRRA